MKTIDRKVRVLSRKPFAAVLALGLMGFALDLAVNSTENSAENRLSSVIESPFLATSAQAAEGLGETRISSQTTEAKARLLFKKNESSSFPRYWVEGLE